MGGWGNEEIFSNYTVHYASTIITYLGTANDKKLS